MEFSYAAGMATCQRSVVRTESIISNLLVSFQWQPWRTEKSSMALAGATYQDQLEQEWQEHLLM